MLGRQEFSKSSISLAFKTTQEWRVKGVIRGTWILAPTRGHCAFSASASPSLGGCNDACPPRWSHPFDSKASSISRLHSHRQNGPHINTWHFSCHYSLNKQNTWYLQLLGIITNLGVIKCIHEAMHRLRANMTFYVTDWGVHRLEHTGQEGPEINSPMDPERGLSSLGRIGDRTDTR